MNARLGVEDPEKYEGYYDIESARITGFLAQEVEEAARAIGYDFSGIDHAGDIYSLRYAEFVVPLVKAVQEQQAQIDLLEPAAVEALQVELQEVRAGNATMQQELYEVKAVNADIMNELLDIRVKNARLEEKNADLEYKVDQILGLLKQQAIELGSGPTNDPSRASSDHSDRNMDTDNARLEQNAPNPFQDNTVIRYSLPENTGKAQLIVFDLLGNRIQTNNISGSGIGELTIHGGALSPGTYVYSLIIDGQVADSKRMVLL